MFLEKRVYQGSSGAVYPFPIVESVADESSPREHNAVFLENDYLKIMLLPELGGRVQMALDKTNDYHFVYYNRVIKPALVGLTGPWISGGIEFNWPQHHRPSTYHPVDIDFIENGDGSATVACSEIDRMAGTKGMHWFTLHPDRAYLQIDVCLYNRTSLPETFLWWANPAVHVDENHQSIFPPDVTAVMDHGKRDVSSFPIATGEYYKVDYSPGTDISRYRNIPVPTSYMAYHSDYDFVGSYDHGREAGLLHVASRHVSPGKKQWTWGCGDFGRAWDRQLTDEDGPYVELMCGVFTDNQPDFSWLAPGEERAFTQYFMPYKGVGVIKNATIDAAVGLEVVDGVATMRAYTTSPRPACRATLAARGQLLLDAAFDSDPRTSHEWRVDVPAGVAETELQVAILDDHGRQLVAHQPTQVAAEIPAAADPIPAPGELPSSEALYLAGLHLEQYRHATREPDAYFSEGLRRDAGDLRCNVALGRRLLRRGLYAEAARLFRTAVERATRHNANPIDGEPFYTLGLSLIGLGQFCAAEAALHKATWNAAWQDAACFELARLAVRNDRWAEAETLLRRCLDRNGGHHQAVHLLVCTLQKRGATDEAVRLIEAELHRDPFNTGVLFERARHSADHWDGFRRRMRGSVHNYLQLASDYTAAGLDAQAVALLNYYLEWHAATSVDPLLLYHLAAAQRRTGDADGADAALVAAAENPRGIFPNTLADLTVLEAAVAARPDDAGAHCDLGNLLYSKRRYDDAICHWQQAAAADRNFAQPRRNLGLALFNKRHDPQAAWHLLSEAFRLNPSDARVLFELDQLAKRLNHDPLERLNRLQDHGMLVAARDDLTIERIALLNQLGRHEEALESLLARRFHPWEGGEGKTSAQYVLSLTELARQALVNRRWDRAEGLLLRALDWPHSLGEGKLAGIQENNVHYLLGLATRGAGREDDSQRYFRLASKGLAQPNSAQFYNDQPPETIFYQGLALRALGEEGAAVRRFEKLIEYADAHEDDPCEIDFFAVSLPDFLVFDADLQLKHELHCGFMRALGRIGLNQAVAAAAEFDRILKRDVNHLGAIVHLRLCDGARAMS
jgi:tetratricopeptide (TPR) repeat protein